MRGEKAILIAILALMAIGTAVCLLVPHEPRYARKGLSVWLQSLDKTPLRFNELSVATNHPAAQALLHMGSAAVPHFVHELHARDSKLKLKLMELLGKQSILRIKLTPAYVRHQRAIQACYALGPTAKAAIPELTDLLNERRVSPVLLTFSLAAMGSDALPSMICALTNSNPQVRIYAASAFRKVSFDAEAAVPALVTCLSDPQDYRVRCEAAMALAHIAKAPDVVLPALTRNLDDPDDTVRRFMAMALEQFQATTPETKR